MNLTPRTIAQEIQRNGPITLARFMELALFSPASGYYEQKQEIGQRGDFYTSVSVGSLFGALLAFQFIIWMAEKTQFSIIEAGAHTGQLAGDILAWIMRNQPDTLERMEYVLIEPSPKRREWQRQTLGPHLSRIRWVEKIEDLPIGSMNGVIFSNEFFDAFPAHRLGWDRATGQWKEWLIVCDGDAFVWRLGDLSIPALSAAPIVPGELAAVLPDKFTVEVAPSAAAWWRRAAESLASGRMLTMDYGLTAEERFHPQKANGTLRGYYKHRLADDALANPGEQDMTTHVDFTALQEAGESAGLKTETFASQAVYLTSIFKETQKAPARFDEWTRERVRQFQTLTHPEHLGRPFRALEQSRVIGTLGP